MPNELENMICAAILRFERLPTEEKIKMREAQRRSWVIGEMMIEHPDWSREYAEQLYEKVLTG